MSMRPRTTAISAAAQPQQLPAAQNFKPKSEWRHEVEASFLFVYVPGVTVEQLTITPDYSEATVKVEGQRWLPNNRLLLIDETFKIPQDYDLSKMDKQFGRGVIMLKMPRNIVVPQQQTTEETMEETLKPQETVADSMTPKGTTTTGFDKQSPDEAAIDEKSAMTAPKTDEQKLVKSKKENDAKGRPAKPESPESLVQNNAGVKEEESKAQSKESAMTSAMAAAKVEKKEKEKSRKSRDSKGKLEAEKENTNGSAKKGMVKEVNEEDRKLIVNMGLAVLIIMGLGASLFYAVGR